MLFPIKQKLKIHNWLSINVEKTKSSLFQEIDQTILKTDFRKNKLIKIGSLKYSYFRYHIKQWQFFTKNVLQKAKKKYIFTYYNRYIPKLTIFSDLYAVPSNIYLPGFLTNFHIQKKKQFKTWNPTTYTYNNILKQNKPEFFFFLHISPTHPLIKETNHLTFPILATENLHAKQLSDFPLFLNIFHNKALAETLWQKFFKNTIDFFQQKSSVLACFQNIQQWLSFHKKMEKHKISQQKDNKEISIKNRLSQVLSNYVEIFTELRERNINRKNWKFLTNYIKIKKLAKRLKKKKRRLLLKKWIFFTKTNFHTNKKLHKCNTNSNSLFFVHKLLKSVWYHKNKTDKTTNIKKFQKFFYRHYNLTYVKQVYKIFLYWKNKKIWKRQYWFLLWICISNLADTLKWKKNNFSPEDFIMFFQKYLPKLIKARKKKKRTFRSKIKKTKLKKKLKLPRLKFFWRMNSIWITNFQKALRRKVSYYYKINKHKKYPIWWGDFPIQQLRTNLKKIQIT